MHIQCAVLQNILKIINKNIDLARSAVLLIEGVSHNRRGHYDSDIHDGCIKFSIIVR